MPNQVTNEDTPTGAIPFTVNDNETPPANLTVTGASSNTTLVPNANIVFGGSGTNRTVTVTPAANQYGAATITVTVTDGGGLTASDTFVLTVNAVNDPPTISNIPDQSTNQDTPKTVSFTVGDVDNDVNTLTLSGTSSNTTLLPNGNISFGGAGANRTVTLTPAAGQTGSTTVTITVSDGSLTASDTFVLTVAPAGNTPPTISDIPNQVTNEDTPTGAIAFTVDDNETPPANLTVTGASSNTTLVPNANIVFGGSGMNRTVTITPAANQYGVATITVTVTDGGGLTASDTFVLTVNAVNDPPTISNIPDQSTNQDTPKTVSFTVGDVDNDVNTLTLSGTSSNTTLLPNGNISFGGAGANRTVTLTPAAGQTGSTTVTITVSDGSLTASDTFVLTVAPAGNTPPTISDIPNQVTNEDTPTGAIAFTVDDNETPPANLTVTGASSNTTLVPNANIVFGGSGMNRTVTITPAANQYGAATITVTVTDGGGLTAS
ncbi:MAG: Ig-like domain-containing protein, partial [Planctomycetota bacterium]|nr:Ig-like domain-containing protein [Planctomycetota bacterium]